MLINTENLEMTGRHTLSFLALICLSVPLVLSRQPHFPDLCDGRIQWDPRGLQTNQMTVLINGYSESRIPLLHTITAAYSSSALVSSVLIIWGNPSTPMQTLTQLSHNLSFSSPGSAPISVLRQSSASLNSRFLPRQEINTRAVLICDDDVLIDLKSLEFAFQIWTSNQDRMIGFFSRSHDFDLATKDWIYTVHPDRYSILLTKAMIIKSEYLFQYSCGDRDTMIDMRNVVDQMHNCEDVLMNFVVADAVNAGPILVGAERARDWGDSRNEVLQKGHEMVEEKEAVKEVGLSSRRGDHRKRRGECITKFHRILGRMPLRYSYGKVVDSVGEQGLCKKGDKLVFCDKQVHQRVLSSVIL